MSAIEQCRSAALGGHVLRCEGCEREWDPEDAWFRCTGCGGAGAVIAGNELEVESIEVEEAACTA